MMNLLFTLQLSLGIILILWVGVMLFNTGLAIISTALKKNPPLNVNFSTEGVLIIISVFLIVSSFTLY
jgi:hypothetical protein